MPAASRLDELLGAAALEAQLTSIRSNSRPLLDEEHGPQTPAIARGNSRLNMLLMSPGAPSTQKRIARILGWRFRDILRLWRIAHRNSSHWENTTMLAICCITVLAQIISLSLPVYSGRIVSELTGGDTHGAAADGAALGRDMAQALGIVLVYIVMRCSATLMMLLAGIRWRDALTRALERTYMQDNAFYKVQLFECDNPDQRIASDVNNFVKLCCGGVSPPYSSVLGSLLSNLSLAIAATVVSVQRAGWSITLISYAYNALTILVNVLVSIPIAGSTAVQEAREGDFRHGHLRVQTYAEPIALYRGDVPERERLEGAFGALIANQRKLSLQYFRLIVCITFTQVGGSLIGLIIAATSIWTGQRRVFNVAELSAVLGTLEMLTGSIQALPGLLPEITTIAGLSKRVIELHRVLEAIAAAPPPSVVPHDSAETLACRSLAFSTPDGKRRLGKAITLTVTKGTSVVVTGESGCGKSSLLRCIAGLWEADAGDIFRPAHIGHDGLLVLPQKPYMCPGSLLEQVTYPLPREEARGLAAGAKANGAAAAGVVPEDASSPRPSLGGSTAPGHGGADACRERVRRLLVEVGLAGTVQQFGLDTLEPWEDVLSLGEQQRVSFARLLFHRPRFALMDEATSALDANLERTCMQLVVDAGIAMLSVAHRESVMRFHQLHLHMRRDGTYSVEPVSAAPELQELPAGSPRDPGSNPSSALAHRRPTR